MSASVRLDGCRAVITGGAGLIGSTIADQLVRRGAGHVVVFDDFSRGTMCNLAWAQANGSIEVVRGDIRDLGAVEAAVRGADVVFHQAAIRIVRCAEEPRTALEVLVDGSFNVIDAASRAGVGKLVAASSASVFGQADAFPTTEDQHPYHNRTIYGAAKTFLEGLLRSFNDTAGFDYVALRYFNVYGPRMDVHGAYTEVLVRWMERIAAGEPPLILGDGTQTMDFVYVDDIARANLAAAESAATDVVCNVGTGVETSLAELASALASAMGADGVVEHGPERAVNGVRRRQADTTRAAELLGFRTETDLAEGLRRLVGWWRDQRDVPTGTPPVAEAVG